MKNSKKLPRPLFLILLVSAFPVILGSLLYYFHDYFSLKTLNRGVLVKPLIQAEYLYPKAEDGKQKKWHMVYFSPATCDAQCAQKAFFLHQVPKILGKDQTRVSVVELKTQNPVAIKLQKSFIDEGKNNFVVQNKIYLIDPLGNLFMYYPDTIDPMNILKDLKRVLEVSQIG